MYMYSWLRSSLLADGLWIAGYLPSWVVSHANESRRRCRNKRSQMRRPGEYHKRIHLLHIPKWAGNMKISKLPVGGYPENLPSFDIKHSLSVEIFHTSTSHITHHTSRWSHITYHVSHLTSHASHKSTQTILKSFSGINSIPLSSLPIQIQKPH